MEYKRGKNACEQELKQILKYQSQSGKSFLLGIGFIVLWYVTKIVFYVDYVNLPYIAAFLLIGGLYLKFGTKGKIRRLEEELERLNLEDKNRQE
jgi:Flp pilus assembly protein TadB